MVTAEYQTKLGPLCAQEFSPGSNVPRQVREASSKGAESPSITQTKRKASRGLGKPRT